MSLGLKKKSKAKLKKTKSIDITINIDPDNLTFDGLKTILELPTYQSNKLISFYHNFIDQTCILLNNLSSSERYKFLNGHINETKMDKWHKKKLKYIKVKTVQTSLHDHIKNNYKYKHNPLSISFYNFTYAHTSMEISKIWLNFINLILDIKNGAECDLNQCHLINCTQHLTIILQMYQFVNTSDESLYGINANEFAVRGGFQLLIKVFNKCHNYIPPIILTSQQYKEYKLPDLAKYPLELKRLYAIGPNQARFIWIKQMLLNGHPIMSNKEYLQQLFEEFYAQKKIKNPNKSDNKSDDNSDDDKSDNKFDADADEEELDDGCTDDDDDDDITGTIQIASIGSLTSTVISYKSGGLKSKCGKLGVLTWLMVMLPCLLDVRKEQKDLLTQEFLKNPETETMYNSGLIDVILDYLYWNQRYIKSQILNIRDIILSHKNELILFNYIINEYSGMLSMNLFINNYINLHISNKRNVFQILFNENIENNNIFYLKMMDMILKYLHKRINDIFPYITQNIIKWDKMDIKLVNKFIDSVLSYMRYYAGNGLTSLNCSHTKLWNSKQWKLSTQKSNKCLIEWIIKILKLMKNKYNTHLLIYKICDEHFRHINDGIELFTLQLIRELINDNDIDIDIFDFYIINGSIVESLFYLLCRCCFDAAIKLFLDDINNKNKVVNILSIQKCHDGSVNNSLLCLTKGFTKPNTEINHARINILKMICNYAKKNKLDIKKAILQKDTTGAGGKNSMEYAKNATRYNQSLYNEMKTILFA